MTNGISNNYSLANLSNTLTTKAMSNAAATTGSGSTNGMSASNIGSTFLNLLTQELQNQDPTSPMDSTAMVGQMISLNSLSQLIGINQTLSGVAGSSGSSTSGSGATTQQQAVSSQQTLAGSAKDAAAAAIQAAASSANPLSYLFPMNQLAGHGTSAANVGAAQSALLSSPSAIR